MRFSSSIILLLASHLLKVAQSRTEGIDAHRGPAIGKTPSPDTACVGRNKNPYFYCVSIWPDKYFEHFGDVSDMPTGIRCGTFQQPNKNGESLEGKKCVVPLSVRKFTIMQLKSDTEPWPHTNIDVTYANFTTDKGQEPRIGHGKRALLTMGRAKPVHIENAGTTALALKYQFGDKYTQCMFLSQYEKTHKQKPYDLEVNGISFVAGDGLMCYLLSQLPPMQNPKNYVNGRYRPPSLDDN